MPMATSIDAAQERKAAWAVGSIEDPDAFDAYRHGMSGLFQIENVGLAARRRFYNRSGMALTDCGVVGWGDSPAQTMTRTRRHIGRTDIDGLTIVVNLTSVAADCDGRDVSAQAGDVQFRDLSRPATARYDRVRLATLMIPRRAVPKALLDADLHGRVLARDSEAGRILGGHVRLLSRLAPLLSPGQLDSGVRAALILATRGVEDLQVLAPEEETALRVSLRWRAARMIEQRLMDPALEPGLIARACGGSRATLYRAFEAEGGVRRYIQSRRIERAYRHLLSDAAPRRIGDVALAHGFVSQPHFTRLFRARFGCAPSSVGPDGVSVIEASPQAPLADAMRHGEAVAWLRRLKADA